MDLKSNLVNLVRIISLLLLILSMSGCAFHRAEIIDPIALTNNKNVYVYGYDDELDINKNIINGLTGLGFTVSDNKSEANLIADYYFKCHWDLVHYTCSSLNFYISDSKTKKILLKAKFRADSPFSTEKLVNDLFEKIDHELKMKVPETISTL